MKHIACIVLAVFASSFFSVARAATISGQVWSDQDNNSIQDAGEPGVPGVVVRLLDGAANELAKDTTDSGGNYSFSGLAAGSYQIHFIVSTAPIGLRKIAQQHVTLLIDQDSDPDAQGYTDIINIAAATNDVPDIDMGLQVSPTATISGLAWQDLDGNQLLSAGDTTVSGIAVMLRDSAGMLIYQDTTDATGKYSFSPVEYGKYVVVFDTASFPASLVPVAKDQGNDDNVDSDVNPDGRTDTLVVAGDLANVDLGLRLPPPDHILAGKVWFDTNQNDLFDAGEPGVPNVFVSLLDTAGVELAKDTTDANGDYAFTHVATGSYYVRFDTASLSSSYQIVAKDAGSDDSVDSDANPDGTTDLINLTADLTTVFLGVYNPPVFGAVSGQVWQDDVPDNVYNFGEPLIANMPVYLISVVGDTSMTTTTATDGKYAFSNIMPGSYQVAFDLSILPSGFDVVAKDFGPDDSVDSDVDSLGMSDTLTVLAGQTISFLSMGVRSPASPVVLTTDSLNLQTMQAEFAHVCVDTSELPGQFAALQVCGVPLHGNLLNFQTNCLDYMPDLSFVGLDTFCLLACDDQGNCDTTFVFMEVKAISTQKPVAVDDVDTVPQGATRQLSILLNDTLYAPLQSLTIINYPNLGAAEANSFGFISYTAEPNVCGDTVSLRYEVCTQYGCDTATVHIYLACNELKVFDAFSPNEDGVNDYFVIQGISKYPNNKLTIFNRWGARVFEQSPYDNTWNGYWDDQNTYLPDGTYFFILDTGTGSKLTGSFEIHR